MLTRPNFFHTIFRQARNFHHIAGISRLRKMAFSMSRIQPFRDLLFTSAIFISALAFTASSTPVAPSFQKLTRTVFPRNQISDYGNTTETVLHLEPKTCKLFLPWWTQLVGAGIDFCLALYTVTFAWEKRGAGTPRSGWIKIAGLIHLAANSRKYLIPAGKVHYCTTFLDIRTQSISLPVNACVLYTGVFSSLEPRFMRQECLLLNV
jgi:hypothetical protein